MEENLTMDPVSESIRVKAQEILNGSSEFNSKAQLLSALQSELELIASKLQLSIEELTHKAEASQENRDEFDRALRLQSMIFSLKK